MARDIDPYKLSSPQVFLWRMGIFLVLAGNEFIHRELLSAIKAA
jgi:hypothetical protein